MPRLTHTEQFRGSALPDEMFSESVAFHLPKSDTLTSNSNGRHGFFFFNSKRRAQPVFVAHLGLHPRSREMFIAHYVLIYSSLFSITSSWPGLRLLKSPLTSCMLRVVRDV